MNHQFLYTHYQYNNYINLKISKNERKLFFKKKF